MGFEPNKFFIGLMDFFSILLPGAIVTYIVRGEIGHRLLGDSYPDLEGSAAVAAFLLVAYLAGHIVFMLGTYLDPFYDRLRKLRPVPADREARLLTRVRARMRAFARHPLRRLASLVFGARTMDDLALDQVKSLKQTHLGTAAQAINAFQWSKATLLLEHPEAFAKIERLEADSKFFRSLVVLFLASVVGALVIQEFVLAAVVAVLAVLAFWRYADQRLKSVTHAYWYVMTLKMEPVPPAGTP